MRELMDTVGHKVLHLFATLTVTRADGQGLVEYALILALISLIVKGDAEIAWQRPGEWQRRGGPSAPTAPATIHRGEREG